MRCMEPTGVDVDELIEFWTYPERDTPSSVHMKSTRYSLMSAHSAFAAKITALPGLL